MISQRLILTTIFCGLIFSLNAQVEHGSFIDPRDGQTYKTITVGIMLESGATVQRTGMAQNLNYEAANSFCYKNKSAYCEAYGRLYTFNAAYDACPDKWRLPTLDDWNMLFMIFGGTGNAGFALQKGGESGLDLIPGGFGDPEDGFKNIGIRGNYWGTEKKSEDASGLVSIQKGSKEIFYGDAGENYRNSCRCIKELNKE